MEIRGERSAHTAREADGDEREEIWARMVEMYSGYERYRSRAGRKIPVLVLTPVSGARDAPQTGAEGAIE